MTGLAWAVVLLPLVAAGAGLVPPRLLVGWRRSAVLNRPLSAITALAGTGLATLFLIPVWLSVVLDPRKAHESGVTYTPTGRIDIFLGVRVDGLSASVAVLVCVVALAVQFYSVAYLRHDPHYRSYAAYVSLFTGAMLLVVFSADLIVLLVGWEVMGFCSYILIGHYWERVEYSRAGVKAFLITKLGDVPFLFGIFALGSVTGSFRIGEVLAALPYMHTGVIYAGTLLLLGGVIGKSAQFPLHTWLPDAMAGPTPVSALIHAATMVAAGAYVVARLYPAFQMSPPALAVLGVVAAVSMLGAACAAFAQDDLKRVLAYSTISQVAYMQAGLATGGYTAGVMHLLAHGAFKALLFLCAGVVIVRFGTNLMSGMGGSWRTMTLTWVCMAVGFAALVGVPPTSGFFTKDAVLESALHQSLTAFPILPRAVAVVVVVAGLLTVFMTACYATRAMLLTFFGPLRADRPVSGDVEPVTAAPLLFLAMPAVFLGGLGLYRAWLPSWVSSAGTEEPAAMIPDVVTAVLSFVLLVCGVGLVYFSWVAEQRDPVRVVGPLRRAFDHGFYVDTAYELVFVRGTTALAQLVARMDTDGIDATVSDAGRLTRWAGAMARRTQTGNAQWYVTCVAVGAIALAVGAVVLT